MSDFRLLIFDWDGTLVDSIARIVESIQVAAACCELPPLPAEPIKAIIGLSLSRAIDVLYPQFDDPLGRERFRQAYADHYLALEEQPSPLFPGVAEALQAFRQVDQEQNCRACVFAQFWREGFIHISNCGE